jgi:branched-chain amino acid transport system permease protein
VAGIFGAVAALPALRLRADYLAIVTVAFSEIIRLSLLSDTFREFTVAGATVGTGGGRGIGLPTNPVRAIFYNNPDDTSAGLTPVGDALFGAADAVGVVNSTVVSWTYTLVLLVFVALFYWLLVRTGNSPFGRVLKAIREDELVASSLGKNTRRFKITAFVVGCALMGLAGILWEGSKGFTNPSVFIPLQTFYVFVALIIGGAGSNTGSVLGGALFASLLFEGPTFVGRIVEQVAELGTAPVNFAQAVGALGSGDVGGFLAYAVGNIPTLRFILVGVVLVYLMQNRPKGVLGHRSEVASPIDLTERGRSGDEAVAATDGCESDA